MPANSEGLTSCKEEAISLVAAASLEGPRTLLACPIQGSICILQVYKTSVLGSSRRDSYLNQFQFACCV